MDSQFQRYSKNFKVAFSILLNIKKNNGKLDSDFGLDRGHAAAMELHAGGHGVHQERREELSLRKKAKASCSGMRCAVRIRC